MLGASKQRQLEEVVGEWRLDLRREHARGHARGASGEVAALDERDPRAARGEEIGDRAADHAAAHDDDVGGWHCFKGRRRPDR